MRIEVVGKHLDITPPIREYAESKCAKLPRYYDGVQEIVVRLSRESKHDEFEIELRVDVEKRDDFVVKHKAHDVYEGIDLAIDRMARQLTDFKERLKNSKH